MIGVMRKDDIKVFTRSFQCLQKIGETLTVETTPTRCSLRTLSQSQAAYCHFLLRPEFFYSYEHSGSGAIKCEVNIRIVPNEGVLVFELLSKQGMKRTHKFRFNEIEVVLQADFSRASSPNFVSIAAKTLQKYLNFFHPSTEEITAVVNDSQMLTLRSYHDDEASRGSRTEYKIRSSDFKEFKVTPQCFGSEITFCMTELKAMLSCCKDVVNVFFERGGQPILMSNSVDGKLQYVIDVVAATLPDEMEDEFSGGVDAKTNSIDGMGDGKGGMHYNNAASSSMAMYHQRPPPPTTTAPGGGGRGELPQPPRHHHHPQHQHNMAFSQAQPASNATTQVDDRVEAMDIDYDGTAPTLAVEAPPFDKVGDDVVAVDEDEEFVEATPPDSPSQTGKRRRSWDGEDV